MMDEKTRKVHDALAKAMVDQGKLIEGGFALFEFYTMHPDAPQIQRDEMRTAFMAGAQHLFGALMCMLDPGEESTDTDMRRIGLIHAELNAWAVKLALRVSNTAG